MNDEQVEEVIQSKELNAPRVTPDLIKDRIESASYAVFHGVLTVCVLKLSNGFTVTGESACASPENFDAELGEEIAFKNAMDKIWPLEGYLLRQRLHDGHTLVRTNKTKTD